MEVIGLLREKLYEAIDREDQQEILNISKELDWEILKFIAVSKLNNDD